MQPITGLKGSIEIKVAQAQAALRGFAQDAKQAGQTWAASVKQQVTGSKAVNAAVATVAVGHAKMKSAIQTAWSGSGAALTKAKAIMASVGQQADVLRRKVQSLGAATRDMGQKAKTAFGAMSSSASRVVTVVTAMSVGVVGALTAIGFRANEMEQSSKRAFTQLLGDGEKAQKLFEDLRSFAAKTPFELGTVMEQASKLLAQNFKPEEIIPLLTDVGDAVAILGGGDEKIQRVIDALSKMRANGRVSAQEMNMLADASINAFQFLADGMGLSVAEVRKLSEQGMIDADTGITHIMAGIRTKFGGGMALAEGSWSQMWSNMLDTVNQFAGQVTKPLFEVGGQVLAMILSATELPRFGVFVDAVTDAFRRLSVAVFGTSSEVINSGEAIDLLESALVGAIDLVTSGVNAFRDFWPQIRDSAAAIIELVGSVTSYLMEHPKLLQALIAVKVAGFLGITSAIGALIPLLTSLITWLGSVSAAMGGAGGLTASTIAWQAALAALVAYITFEAVTALTGARDEMKKLNEELKRGAKLNDDLAKSTNQRHTREDTEIAAIEDPEQQRQALAEQLERERRNLAGRQETARMAAAQAQTTKAAEDERISQIPFARHFMDGSDSELTKAAEQRAKEAAEQLAAQEQRVRDLEMADAKRRESELATAEAKRKAEEAMLLAGAGLPPDAGGVTNEAGAPPATGMETAKETAKAVAKELAEQQRNRLHGRSQLAETATVARRALDQGVSKEALDPLAREAIDARQSFESGGIDKAAFDETLAGVEQRMNALTQASQGFGMTLSALQSVLPTEAFDTLNQKFAELQQQLAEGDISVDTFKQSIAALSQEAKQADLERRAAGQFTEEEFQQALLQRRAALAEQQMQDKVTEKLREMGLIVDDTAKSMDKVGESADGASRKFDDVHHVSEQDRRQQAENLNTFTQWANTQSGQATLLFNNMQLLAQNLTLGVVDTYRDQRRIARQLQTMNDQLIELTRPTTPILRKTEADFLQDPALAASGGKPTQVSISFPNVQVDSPRMARQVYDAVEQEGRRRGRRGN
jgi:tape measure domain-containing protein